MIVRHSYNSKKRTASTQLVLNIKLYKVNILECFPINPTLITKKHHS